jgi:multiple sugar transport system substrate-binding protein
MKRLSLSLLLAASVLTGLYAGGGGQQGGGSAAPVATGVIGGNLKYDLAAPVNNGRNITIEFWNQNGLPVYEKLAREYMRIHPNVKINITTSAWADYWQKLPLALQTGTGPDIFHMHNANDGLIGSYLAPYPEDVLPLAALKADFTQVDPHVQNGKVTYIDFGVMTSGIFYNKKMWREAGLTEADIPKTWDQFIQAAKKLTKYDANGNITREGFSINDNTQHILTSQVLQNGYFLFNANGKPVVNSDPWKAGLKFAQDFYNVHKVSSIQFPGGSDAFLNEQGAMAYVWGWFGAQLANYPDLEWGFFNLPTRDGKNPPAYDRNNGESTFAVNKAAKKEAQAVGFDILKFFLCSDELLVEMANSLNVVPSKTSLRTHPAIQANVVLKTQADIVDRTIWPGPVPGAWETAITTYAIQGVLLNGKSIDAALTETQAMEERDFVKAFPDFKPVERQYAHAGELR